MSDAGDAFRIERVGLDASDELIEAATAFHNAHLDAVHTLAGTAANYRDARRQPIHLLVRREKTVVGLLESRLVPGRRSVRVLETLALDPICRGRGLARRLFDELTGQLGDERCIIVHFRDPRRAQLERFYARLGFSAPARDGVYRNGDARWRMMRRF